MDPLILKTITSKLQDSLFNKIIAANPNIPSSVVRAVVSRVAELTASSLLADVTKVSNFQLNNIPKQLIGNINPVNIVSGNIGPKGVTNNISGIVQNQLSSQATDKVVSLLERELKQSLPPELKGLVNFGALAATITQTITPTINSAIGSIVTGFSDSIFSRNITPKSTVENIESLFTSLTPTAALEQVNSAFDKSIASKAIQEASNFNINSSDNNAKLAVTQTGFTDPNANYPTKEYAEKSETNKLAQGDPTGTVVQTKNKARMLGAKLPGGDAWDQPESPYRGAYPYNKVTQTESGHIIEIDDTPGSERLHIYHKSGTFVEIDSNGSMVKRTIGSSYEIIDCNGKISISGKADISVNGACNIFVGNDANIEVEGDTNITCHNDITAQAGGTFNLSAVEEFNIASDKVNIEAYTALNVKAGGTYNTSVTQDFNTKVAGSIITQAGGAISTLAAKNISLDGEEVYWNSGVSGEAVSATGSNIGILSGRKTTQDNSVKDPQTLTLADNRSLLVEEETATESDRQEHYNLIIKEGYATAEQLNATPTVVDTADISSRQSIFIEPDIKLKSVTSLPGNYNLSPNFTVGMLSSKAAVTRDEIQAHGEYTYGDIVYNLQAVALNVLEPIKKMYPDMLVTSAFRSATNSSNSKTSQHPRGQGVDIQFKGATKDEYYDIAKKLARELGYDQIILEYCNYTSNPWIHISYSADKNRSQVLTFFNHRKVADGLSRVA